MENTKGIKKDKLSVFHFVHVRRYGSLPPDFLLRMRQFFESNRFQIDAFNLNGSGGVIQGRQRGAHLNFVPKFLFKAEGNLVTFNYYARIRKLGVAAAFVTQGITAAVGAGTLAKHYHDAQAFVGTVWGFVDSAAGPNYQVVSVNESTIPGQTQTHSQSTTTWVQQPTAGSQMPLGSTYSGAIPSQSQFSQQQTGYNQSIPQQTGYNQSMPQQAGYSQTMPQQTGYSQTMPQQTGYTQTTAQQMGCQQCGTKFGGLASMVSSHTNCQQCGNAMPQQYNAQNSATYRPAH